MKSDVGNDSITEMGIYIGIDGMKVWRERSANWPNWPLFLNWVGKRLKIQCESSTIH